MREARDALIGLQIDGRPGEQNGTVVLSANDVAAILTALSSAGLAVVPVEPTSKELSAIAAVYISGASDRIAGNPQRAVPAARQAWREIIDAALPPLASGRNDNV